MTPRKSLLLLTRILTDQYRLKYDQEMGGCFLKYVNKQRFNRNLSIRYETDKFRRPPDKDIGYINEERECQFSSAHLSSRFISLIQNPIDV